MAAQALRAAQRTLTGDRRVQSAHMYYLRLGRRELPVRFEVQRDSDGRSFSARRVTAVQDGRPIFTMSCSFHVPEATPELLEDAPTDTAPPEARQRIEHSEFAGAFDLRTFGETSSRAELFAGFSVRVEGDCGDDPEVHDCLLLYVSDMGTAWSSGAPEGTEVGPSLDHAIWFHRRTRLDRWHRVALDRRAAADARGLYTGSIWDADGAQVATIAQENLLR